MGYWVNGVGRKPGVYRVGDGTRLADQCGCYEEGAVELVEGVEAEEWRAVELGVEHVRQDGVSAVLSRNDCGQACAVMLMRYLGVSVGSVDEYTRKLTWVRSHGLTTFGDHVRGMRGYGVDGVYRRPLRMVGVLRHLYAGEPVMVLVNYGVLYPGRNFGHFMVVVGTSMLGDRPQVVVNDPLSNVRTIDAARFVRAYGDSRLNMGFQGMTAHV